MDNALTIIGFYFTLIGFISGLFFTRLDAGMEMCANSPGNMKVRKPSRISTWRIARSSASPCTG